MPLEKKKIDEVLAYCKRDLPSDMDWYRNEFDFINDTNLRDELARAFYASRYIYKLMEALAIDGDELHAHLKFQMTQYASIYEAAINWLLLNRYKENEKVKNIQLHKAYRPVAALAGPTSIQYDGEQVHPCLYKDAKTPWTSIPFQDKVDAACDIGLIEESLGDEIKEFYQLRNAIHIESAAKRQIDYEIDGTKLAYRRLRPFVDQIKEKIAVEKAENA